ncbi:hypothetical protein CRUP_023790 [Coryphaenoides rupestris]|nr:hypothetical protein CRUP_023790 [Coryphaenoides rupestris]
MHEPQQYDSPPVYSPPQHVPQPYYQHQHQPPGSYYLGDQGGEEDGRPQLFYRWFSPPGFVKTFQAATAIMCFVIFACVASTLVWDMHGLGYGGGYGMGVSGMGGPVSAGGYGYANSYMTPYSAKSAMISVAAINFLVSLGFLVSSFSRSRAARGRGFYLAIFICDVILAGVQGIIDIIFVIGVNPMSQSSQSMLYNPMLMMCQNLQGVPSISAGAGSGFPGGLSMYTQYLHHYCYMDPEERTAPVAVMAPSPVNSSELRYTGQLVLPGHAPASQMALGRGSKGFLLVLVRHDSPPHPPLPDFPAVPAPEEVEETSPFGRMKKSWEMRLAGTARRAGSRSSSRPKRCGCPGYCILSYSVSATCAFSCSDSTCAGSVSPQASGGGRGRREEGQLMELPESCMSRMSVSMGVLPTRRMKKSWEMRLAGTARRAGSRSSSRPKRCGCPGYCILSYSVSATCAFSCSDSTRLGEGGGGERR